MRKLLLLALFIAAVPLQAADNTAPAFDVKKAIGLFKGTALNGPGLQPVETTFYVGREGELLGGYVLSGPDHTFRGHLSNAQFDGPRQLTMEWTDKDGEGSVDFEFSADYKSFTGEWSDNNGGHGPWSGKKQ
ncbi:MAG TPA: hypothetical protein VMH83_10145 [Candidatus Acidoferrum sp.]|nr:hypothetical protein [Candidatus Acidoferrum sp.]